jgi:hypothetical protein
VPKISLEGNKKASHWIFPVYLFNIRTTLKFQIRNYQKITTRQNKPKEIPFEFASCTVGAFP